MAAEPITDKLKSDLNLFGIEFQSESVVDQLYTVGLASGLDVDDLVNAFLAFHEQTKSRAKQRIVTASDVSRFEKQAAQTAKEEKPADLEADVQPGFLTPQKNAPSAKLSANFKTPSSAHRPAKLATSSAKKPSGNRSEDRSVGLSTPTVFKAQQKVFRERNNEGEVVASYGFLPDEYTWESLPGTASTVKISIEDPSTYLTEQYPLMFIKYQEVAKALEHSMEELGVQMALKYNIPESAFSAPNIIGDGRFILGRILPARSGELNPSNLWLQASSSRCGGVICKLDISMVKSCTLFPGQVFAARGAYNGKSFVAAEIFTGVLPKEVKLSLPDKDTLHIAAACGPFNLAGEVQPDPLKEFIDKMSKTKPDLIILMGPFVDEALTNNENFFTETTFEDHFKSLMHFKFSQIPDKLHIPLVIVPSAGQLGGMPVYPVPRLNMPDCVPDPMAFIKSDVPRLVIFAPEPALLNINGVLVGLTSTDIVSHLFHKEMRWKSPGQPADTTAHLLLQQNFHPLYPPVIASDIAAAKEFAKISDQPHILITPSEVPGFAKFVSGTVCVNPEKLAQGNCGGCFARIFLRTADEYHGDIATRTAVDIVRI